MIDRQQLLEQLVTLFWRRGESMMLEAVRAAAAVSSSGALHDKVMRAAAAAGIPICDVDSAPAPIVWLIVSD